jgi:hypothetical protein
MNGRATPGKEEDLVQRDNERADLAREGLEHLQAAAREMIAAARSVLDACEELLDDPRAGETVASIVGSVARAVGNMTGLAPSGEPDEDDNNSSRVQRIKIS